MEKILTSVQHLVYVNLTSAAAIAGGLLLWVGFVFIGLIARRYEQAYGLVTHWQFQIIAPVGLVAYLIMQAVASWQHHNLSPIEQWIGYTLLAWSAALCLWGVLRFRKVLEEIL
jgi:hypothetical protein